MPLPPDTVESIACNACGETASGTGDALTARGWRHLRFFEDWIVFFCRDCRPDLEASGRDRACVPAKTFTELRRESILETARLVGEGLSNAEIAVVQGVPMSTLRTRRRALRRAA